METKFKETIKTTLGLIIAIVTLYYVARNISIRDLTNSFEEIRSGYFLLVIILLILSYWARAYRWRVLLLPFKKTRVTEVYFTMMTGFLGNVLPLRAGDLLRAYILKRRQGISLSGALATILMEWFFDIVLLLILFVWVFKFHTEAFNFAFPDSGVSTQMVAKYFGQFCLVLITGLFVFIYFFLKHKNKLLTLANWFSHYLTQNWDNKVKSFLGDLNLGFSVVKNNRILFQVIFYSTLEWLLTILAFYPMFLAYNFGTPSLGSLTVLTVMIVMFTTILPTPGFLGSFNAGVYVALHHLMGKSEVLAVNFGLMAWILNFLVIFISGFYFILKEQLSLRTIWKAE